jgi:hypothetical protein
LKKLKSNINLMFFHAENITKRHVKTAFLELYELFFRIHFEKYIYIYKEEIISLIYLF